MIAVLVSTAKQSTSSPSPMIGNWQPHLNFSLLPHAVWWLWALDQSEIVDSRASEGNFLIHTMGKGKRKELFRCLWASWRA